MNAFAKMLAPFLVIICVVPASLAQDKLRRIEQPAKFVYSNTPIEVEFKMGGKYLAEREVKAGPDWLRNISLEVTNTSGKDIKWLLINLVIREPVLGVREPTAETAGIVITVELRHSDVKLLSAGDRITNSDDSWLALDRNRNGLIDDGSELFGCASPQPVPRPGDLGNGFIALAQWDKVENGGNQDNQIDRQYEVFASLQLWRDINHNGISESNELKRLQNSEIRIIELDYRESRREDEHGNKFKYRARVRDERGAQVGRWAWDVFPKVVR